VDADYRDEADRVGGEVTNRKQPKSRHLGLHKPQVDAAKILS
jgi:hypothetical protein